MEFASDRNYWVYLIHVLVHVKNVNPMDLVVVTRLVPETAVLTDRAVTLASSAVTMEPVVPPDKHVVMEIAVTQAHVKVV